MNKSKVIVLGAGVSGLTAAYHLLLQAEPTTVEIWSPDHENPGGPSRNAFAICDPEMSDAESRMRGWNMIAHRVFSQIAEADRNSGVTMRTLLDLHTEPQPEPWWAKTRHGFRHATPNELGSPYRDGLVAVKCPVIEPTTYITWLKENVRQRGGTFVERQASSFDEPLGHSDVVINCTGLASRQLISAPEKQPYPQWIQVLKIRRTSGNAGFNSVVMDAGGPNGVAVIVSHSDYIKIGSVIRQHDESPDPKEEFTASILERCSRLVPGLTFTKEQILETTVCIRPGRSTPLVERDENYPDVAVVHNVAHSGGGFALSHGCGAEACHIIGQA